MKTVLITGGTGMVGRRLTDLLIDRGYRVIWLSRYRDLNADVPTYRWDYRKNEIDLDALEQADAIIHLAGSNLSEGAWTESKKNKSWRVVCEQLSCCWTDFNRPAECLMLLSPPLRPGIMVSV